jgi:hypothetical protein
MGWVESNSKSQRNFSISDEHGVPLFIESAGIAINKIVCVYERERGGLVERG